MFEYRVDRIRPAQEGTAVLLNAVAAEGWELVAAVGYSDGPPLLIMPPPRFTLEEPPAIVESLSAPAYYADGRVFKDLGHNVDVLFWVWRAGEPIEQVRIRIPKQALLITPQWLPPILLVRENAHHC